MPTLHSLVIPAANKLQLQFSEPQRTAEILLAHVLHVTRSHVLAHPEQSIDAPIARQFNHLVTQACMGTPLAYLLGQQEFCGLTLIVNASTLIPRPETELLVEHILEYCGPEALPFEKGGLGGISILDLGTGSGAIALALAKARPHWKIVATDISAEALAVAQQNQEQLQLSNVQLLHSDWFSAIPKHHRFHVIVSNPPYIAHDDSAVSDSVRRFEPHTALFCHEHGLEHLNHIISHAKHYLYPGGMLLVEHGYQQHQAVQHLFKEHAYQNIHFLRDEQHFIRVCCGRKK